MTGRAALAVAGGCLALAGCFGAPERPRYVQPASALLGAGGPAAPAPVGSGQPLRLRNLESAAALERRVLWRLSEVEIGYAGAEQWTELPAAYLEQALRRELFEVRGLARAYDADAPTLDLVLRRFEEVREEEQHQVRVTVTLSLADGPTQRGLVERTIEVVRPVNDEGVEAMARAMGGALDDAVRQVADAVVRGLAP